jgi:hypothetical protein
MNNLKIKEVKKETEDVTICIVNRELNSKEKSLITQELKSNFKNVGFLFFRVA